MRTRMTAIGMALLAVLGLAGTATGLTIFDLVTNKNTYDGQSVTVTGTVELALPVGSESAYDLRDGTRKVTVISRSSAPATGARLSVTGTVRVFHEGDGGPEENDWPPALVESSRAPAP